MANKTATVELNIWWNAETGHIHIAAHDGFISTVNCVPGSARCHENLYWKLADSLRTEGLPCPDRRN